MIKRNILFILIWVFLWWIHIGYAAQQNINVENLSEQIQRGNFVPVALLSMKQPIFSDAVWWNDTSILRFVSTSEPLTTREYKPDDLVSMSGTYLNQAGRNSYIRAIAKPSMDAMAYEFSEYFGEPLVVFGVQNISSDFGTWGVVMMELFVQNQDRVNISLVWQWIILMLFRQRCMSLMLVIENFMNGWRKMPINTAGHRAISMARKLMAMKLNHGIGDILALKKHCY